MGLTHTPDFDAIFTPLLYDNHEFVPRMGKLADDITREIDIAEKLF